MTPNLSKSNLKPASVLRALKRLGDTLLPGICVCCGLKTSPDDNYICSVCKGKIRNFGGKKLVFPHKAGVASAYYLFPYDEYLGVDFGNAVRVLKYEGHWKLASELSGLLTEVMLNYPVLTHADIITAIPLHHARLRQRGFNQSELIARYLTEHLPVKYLKLLKRTRNTPQQMELSTRDRELNVKGVFSLETGIEIADKGVIIIDDQITTGATLDNAGVALLEVGAAWVSCLTLTH